LTVDTVLQKFPSSIACTISDHSCNRSLSSQKGEHNHRNMATACVLDVRMAYCWSIREKSSCSTLVIMLMLWWYHFVTGGVVCAHRQWRTL